MFKREVELNVVVLEFDLLGELSGVKHEHVRYGEVHGEVFDMFRFSILNFSLNLSQSIFDR